MEQKNNLENVIIIRKYLDYLKEADGAAPSTLGMRTNAIAQFENFINYKNFKVFNNGIAKRFKQHLYDYRKNDGESLSIATVKERFNSIRDFLLWLYNQPGYRSHIKITDINYLKITRNDQNAITSSSRFKKTPKFDEALALIHSIPSTNEIDRRDRAIISFTILTGIRADTLRSLRLVDVDLLNMTVKLDSIHGVNTKFGKYNEVVILPFKEELLDIVRLWIKELITDKDFSNKDPLFPMTKMNNTKNHFGFNPTEVKNEFWKKTGPINKIFKERAAAANLPMYTPHSFRRLNFQYARQFVDSMDELSAISQNLGHTSIEISDSYYGNVSTDERKVILEKMRFDKTPAERKNEDSLKIDEMYKKIMED